MPLSIERRAAGIALVDRRVDLDIIVIRACADIAAARGNDARGHRAAETERIADRDHPVTDARRRVRELHVGKILLALDLDQREVGLLVGADHLGGIDGAVVGGDLDGLGVVDHVVVGHGITVRRNEEARTFAGDDLVPLRHAVGNAEAELPELLERRTGLIGISSRSLCIAAPFPPSPSILTRTEITAGFTLATRSAKPGGVWAIGFCCVGRGGAWWKTEVVAAAGPRDKDSHAKAGNRSQQRQPARLQHLRGTAVGVSDWELLVRSFMMKSPRLG